ncbi:unnamed protein product [Didymodactylos carnosus]|uniref:Uncharacterized protein n=1 Tax=Didymodactylos carnosus TaxID=1234261 RepID=A0A8S2E9Q0_9BILA|nr:unnamed protein product [Didymodactylos carnosus]CAF3881028.1 unnamed protein product [Didymodactylos carnosus]
MHDVSVEISASPTYNWRTRADADTVISMRDASSSTGSDDVYVKLDARLQVILDKLSSEDQKELESTISDFISKQKGGMARD